MNVNEYIENKDKVSDDEQPCLLSTLHMLLIGHSGSEASLGNLRNAS